MFSGRVPQAAQLWRQLKGVWAAHSFPDPLDKEINPILVTQGSPGLGKSRILESLWEEMISIKHGRKELDDDEKQVVERDFAEDMDVDSPAGSLIDAASNALQLRINFGVACPLMNTHSYEHSGVPGEAGKMVLVNSLSSQAAYRVLVDLLGASCLEKWHSFTSFFDTTSEDVLTNTIDFVLGLLPALPQHHTRVILLCVDEIQNIVPDAPGRDDQAHSFVRELISLSLQTNRLNRPVLTLVHLAGILSALVEPVIHRSMGVCNHIHPGLVARKYIQRAFDSCNQRPYPPRASEWTPPPLVATWNPASAVPRVLDYVNGHFRALDYLFMAQQFARRRPYFAENADLDPEVTNKFLNDMHSKYRALGTIEKHGVRVNDAFRMVAMVACFGLPTSQASTFGYDAAMVEKVFQEAICDGAIVVPLGTVPPPRVESSWMLLDTWVRRSAGPSTSFPFEPKGLPYWQGWEVFWAKYLALRAHLWSARALADRAERWTTPTVEHYLDGVLWGQQEDNGVPHAGNQTVFVDPQLSALAFQLHGKTWPTAKETSLKSLIRRKLSRLKPGDYTQPFTPKYATSTYPWMERALFNQLSTLPMRPSTLCTGF